MSGFEQMADNGRKREKEKSGEQAIYRGNGELYIKRKKVGS